MFLTGEEQEWSKVAIGAKTISLYIEKIKNLSYVGEDLLEMGGRKRN